MRHGIRHFLFLVFRRLLLKQLWFWNMICSLMEGCGEKIHIHMCVPICLSCSVSLTLPPAPWGAQKRFWRADWIFFSRPHFARFFPCPSGVCTCKQKPRAMASGTGKLCAGAMRIISLITHGNHMRQMPLTPFYR